MSSAQTIIAAYKNALISANLGEEYVYENPKTKLVRINTFSKKIGPIYMKVNEFNKLTVKFIIDKIQAKEITTDPYFNFQILNAYNILYLDGDWQQETEDVSSMMKECAERGKSDMKLALEYLEKNHRVVFHYHLWIPNKEFPEKTKGISKLGYHGFVVCKDDLDEETRMSLFSYVTSNCSYGESILDQSPMKTCQSLLPFATKCPQNGKPSRAYMLVSSCCKFSKTGYTTGAIQQPRTSLGGEQLDIKIDASHIRYTEEVDEEESYDEEEVNDENLDTESSLFPHESEQEYEEENEEEYNEYYDDEEEEEKDEMNTALDTIFESESSISSRSSKKSSKKNLELDPALSAMANPNSAEPEFRDKKPKKVQNYEDDISKAMNKSHNQFIEDNWTWRYGDSNRIVFEFIQSLKYLSPNHVFFKMLKDHNARIKKIIPPVMRYIAFNYTIDNEQHKTIDVDHMTEVIVRLMKPLIEMTVDKDDVTDRDSERSIREHAANWFTKYGPESMFITKELGKDVDLLPIYRDFLVNGQGDNRKKQQWLKDKDSKYDEYDRLWIKRIINKKQGTFEYVHYGKYDKEIVVDGDDPITETWTPAGTLRQRRFKRFEQKCRAQIASWIDFVKNVIMNGISDEIHPFDIRRNPISFDDAFPRKHDDLEKVGTSTFYVKTMQQWCLMFLFAGFYESQSLSDSVRLIMVAFTRKFISIDASKKEQVVSVYNIRQTDSLEAYPYNQWIEDKNHAETEQWMSVIYDQFIYPLLQNIHRSEHLDVLLHTLENANIGLDGPTMKSVKTFGNIGNEIKTICNNVFKSFGGNPKPKMLHAAQCDYFPMRNGWLKWIIDSETHKPTGEYEFLEDTHDMTMGRYTQVRWDGPLETYDKNRPEYKAVKKVLEQIYPDEDGREYCLRHFASVLYGTGYKDKFFVMYGTGSDGKTTIVNAVQAMLGQTGFGSDATVYENGKRIALNRNLKGLASTMKAEALLVTSTKSNHDEGGISEAVDVRLCNTQEPDLSYNNSVILNGATIKSILSGTTSSTRKIYQEATSSVINALIIMQTNHRPSVNDTTDGFKRRFTMYQHQSKFIADESSDFTNMEYHYKADAAVAKNLTDNPIYWQALFYVLLEYAVKNLKEKYLPLSKIPKPKCVEDACTDMFNNNVTPLIGAISKAVEATGDDELGIIHFNTFKAKLNKWNDDVTQQLSEDVPMRPHSFLRSKKMHDRLHEIENELQNRFLKCLYRLKFKELVKGTVSTYKSVNYAMRGGKGKSSYYVVDIGHEDDSGKDIIELAREAGWNTKQFCDKWLRKNTIPSLYTPTKPGEPMAHNNDDVFIVGYKFAEGYEED